MIAGSEKSLHLHDGGFAWPGVLVRGKGRGTASVVLRGMITENRFYNSVDRMTVGSIIIPELLLRPLQRGVGINTESVHPVDDARNILVATALHIFHALALHEVPGSLTSLGARRFATRFFLRLFECFYLYSLRQRTIYRPRVESQSAQSVDIAALLVIFHAADLLDLLVGRHPCVLEVVLRHLAVHLHDHPQSASGDGAIGELGILRILNNIFHHRHTFRRNMVEIHNHKRQEPRDVVSPPSALHDSLRHDGRAFLLKAGELRFQVSLALLVARFLRLFILRQSRLILAANLLQLVGTDYRRHRFPRHEFWLLVRQGREISNFICHDSDRCFLRSLLNFRALSYEK